MTQYMGVDQYGNTYWNLTYPRRDLLRQLDRTHAQKFYVDRGDRTYHIGYIIAGRWITVYEIRRMEREV